MSNIARNRIKSSWTPLNNAEANLKIFEERRALVGKWFEKWTDEQRRTVIADLVNQCKVKQLEFAGELINTKKPMHKDDFTRVLPRVLSLYIFSFLDPRSLCRASHVCWYWKHLSEVDQIWMPKCVRLGWLLSFTPGPFEVGAWKRLYIENIMTLKCMVPKHPQGVSLHDLDRLRLTDSSPQSRPQTGRSSVTGKSSDRPPWRGSDPTPKDTWRNNVLDNDDEVQKINKLRKKHVYGPAAEEIIKRAKNKVQSGQNKTSLTRELLSRSRSGPEGFDNWGTGGGLPGERPPWAKPLGVSNGGAPFVTSEGALYEDAARRPAPVRPGVGKKVSLAQTSPAALATVPVGAGTGTGKTSARNRSPTRSARDPPTTDLFPTKGWQLPDKDEEDSDY